MAGQGSPIGRLVEVMEEVESSINSENPSVNLQLVVRACHLGAQFVTSLEGVFKFAAVEVENKANNLEDASQRYNTVEAMLEYEITNGLTRENSSHTRFHLRMKLGADLLRVFFKEYRILLDDIFSDNAASELMNRYISASARVCQHIEHLYHSTNVGQELLRMI